MGRLQRRFPGWGTAMFAGALFVVFVVRTNPGTSRAVIPVLALIGGFYGLAVLGLLNLFGTRRWGYVVAGLLTGPLPAAILIGPKMSGDDRSGVLFAGLILAATAPVGLELDFLGSRAAPRYRRDWPPECSPPGARCPGLEAPDQSRRNGRGILRARSRP